MQDRTASFETFAGRSAMLGFAAAALLEGVGGSVFVNPRFELSAVALLCAAMVAASALLAASSTRVSKASRLLLEPVLASLTSKSRSRGSVSQREVDSALDGTFESVFTAAFLRIAFPMEQADGSASDSEA